LKPALTKRLTDPISTKLLGRLRWGGLWFQASTGKKKKKKERKKKFARPLSMEKS
jgi:hypothetical protein